MKPADVIYVWAFVVIVLCWHNAHETYATQMKEEGYKASNLVQASCDQQTHEEEERVAAAATREENECETMTLNFELADDEHGPRSITLLSVYLSDVISLIGYRIPIPTSMFHGHNDTKYAAALAQATKDIQDGTIPGFDLPPVDHYGNEMYMTLEYLTDSGEIVYVRGSDISTLM